MSIATEAKVEALERRVAELQQRLREDIAECIRIENEAYARLNERLAAIEQSGKKRSSNG